MEYEISPYTLSYRGGGSAKGWLLSLGKGGIRGRGVCHPWEKRGDIDFGNCKEALLKKHPLPIIKAAYQAAYLEYRAQREKIPLFLPGMACQNNALLLKWDKENKERLSRELKSYGWLIAKVKIDTKDSFERFVEEAEEEFPGLLWILDFNGSLKSVDLPKYRTLFSKIRKKILYIEDPFPLQEEKWRFWQQEWALPLAVDLGAERFLARSHFPFFLVYKPALGRFLEWKRALQRGAFLSVTSYMAHPIEIASSYRIACILKKKFPEQILSVGCATHTVLEDSVKGFTIKEGKIFMEDLYTWGLKLL